MSLSLKSNTHGLGAGGAQVLALADLQAQVAELHELVASQARQIADLERAYQANSARWAEKIADLCAHPPAPSRAGLADHDQHVVMPQLKSLAQRVQRLERAHPPTLLGGNVAVPHPPTSELAQRVEQWAQWGLRTNDRLDQVEHDLTRCLAQQQRWYLSQRGASGREFARTHVPG